MNAKLFLLRPLIVVLAACGGSAHPSVSGHPSVPSPSTVEKVVHRPGNGVTLRIDLPSNTMRTGSAMNANVVVDNDSGHALHVYGCGDVFNVALTNDDYRPVVPFPMCRQRITIPTGRSI